MKIENLVALLAIVAGVVLAIFFGGGHPTPPPPVPPTPPGPVVVNEPPVMFPPVTAGVGAYLIAHEAVPLNYEYRERGCSSSGDPTDRVGAYDPEGGFLDYKITAVFDPYDEALPSVAWSVFSLATDKRVDGRWLEAGCPDLPIATKNPITGELEVKAEFGLVVGYDGDEPPTVVTVLRCDPTPQPPIPPPDPSGDKLGVLIVTTSVRDDEGAITTDSITWPVFRGCL